MRNPFGRSGYPYGSKKRITPEGEPLEGSGLCGYSPLAITFGTVVR
jgi:hypothetical protein